MIGDDLNGDGQIDDNEAKWNGRKKIPKLWRQMATVNGKVYGIPQATSRNMALIFRTDLWNELGNTLSTIDFKKSYAVFEEVRLTLSEESKGGETSSNSGEYQ